MPTASVMTPCRRINGLIIWRNGGNLALNLVSEAVELTIMQELQSIYFKTGVLREPNSWLPLALFAHVELGSEKAYDDVSHQPYPN